MRLFETEQVKKLKNTIGASKTLTTLAGELSDKMKVLWGLFIKPTINQG